MAEYASDIEKVLAINPHAIDARGNLKSLVEQYGEYSLAKEFDPKSTMEYTPFVLAMNCSVFGVPELAGKPLVLTNSSLKHVRVKHDAQIAVLNSLADEMRENLLVYSDPEYKGNLVFVLAGLSENGNRIISIVRAEAHIDGIAVSQVRSVHGKRELDEEISRALDLSLDVYVNERTGDWLRNPRTLPDEAELSSETRQRLLSIYFTRFPHERPGSVKRAGDDPRSVAERASRVAGSASGSAEATRQVPHR